MAKSRSVIQLGAVLLLAGALFDTPSLYVPGAGLLALALGTLIWVRLAASGVRVGRAPGPATAIEGEQYPLRVSIRRGRLPLPGGELRDPALDEPLRLGANPPPVVSAAITVGRRGRRRLEPTRLAVRDPLGIWEREVSGAEAAELLVLPRTEPVATTASGTRAGGGLGGLGDEGDAGDRGAARHTAALASEMDGIRPHEDGMPASRIHWPTVARSGEFYDRHLVPGSESAHLVVLDLSLGGDIESVDAAVRAAASLVQHLAPRGGCALHLPGESRALLVDQRLSGWPHAHARLALVEDDDGRPKSVRTSNRGVAVWVSSGSEPVGRERLVQLAGTASHLVTPAEVPGAKPSFTVSGCSGYSLGAVRRDLTPARAA